MKKILTALMLCLVSICFVGCQDQNAPTAPTQQNVLADGSSTTSGYCLVNISNGSSPAFTKYLSLNSLTIEDKSGKKVGSGNYVGSYYVPCDGKLILTLDYDVPQNLSQGVKTATSTINVASAHELNVTYSLVQGSNPLYYAAIKVGDQTVETIFYQDL